VRCAAALSRARRVVTTKASTKTATPHPARVHPAGMAGGCEVGMARDGHLRGDEGPDDGHTERLADLPGRRGDARSDPGLGPRHARHGSVGDGCVHETEADAEDHIGDEEPRETGSSRR